MGSEVKLMAMVEILVVAEEILLVQAVVEILLVAEVMAAEVDEYLEVVEAFSFLFRGGGDRGGDGVPRFRSPDG
jgi:hypothetical protein